MPGSRVARNQTDGGRRRGRGCRDRRALKSGGVPVRSAALRPRARGASTGRCPRVRVFAGKAVPRRSRVRPSRPASRAARSGCRKAVDHFTIVGVGGVSRLPAAPYPPRRRWRGRSWTRCSWSRSSLVRGAIAVKALGRGPRSPARRRRATTRNEHAADARLEQHPGLFVGNDPPTTTRTCWSSAARRAAISSARSDIGREPN